MTVFHRSGYKQSRERISGFTLIELLISLAILIAISLAGLLMIAKYRESQDIDSAVRMISAIMRDAQNRSIGQEDGRPWGVHFVNTGSSPTYGLFRGATVPPAAQDIVEQYQLSDRLQFTVPASGQTESVTFAAVTGLPPSAKTIGIALKGDPSQSRTITVNTNGTITF